MAEERYKLIVAKDYTEQYFRDMWTAAYCKQEIYTFDGIRVYFYDDNFDHAFYESTDRRQGIHKSKKKDVLSLKRLARLYWIKDVLRDPDAELYVGYESKTKSYTRSKRVAVVKNNYIVVIQIYADKKAKFITAYVADESIGKIKEGPKWSDTKKNAD